ncbi:MAG: hypothetical protein ACFFD4_28175 [Candidatus Odinarchaeota archaeon]
MVEENNNSKSNNNKRADPVILTSADYYRAKKNADRMKRLYESGVTPGQLIKQMLEMMRLEPHRNNKRNL